MTTIIIIILIEELYLYCEKNYILFSIIHVTKTGASGFRIRC